LIPTIWNFVDDVIDRTCCGKCCWESSISYVGAILRYCSRGEEKETAHSKPIRLFIQKSTSNVRLMCYFIPSSTVATCFSSFWVTFTGCVTSTITNWAWKTMLIVKIFFILSVFLNILIDLGTNHIYSVYLFKSLPNNIFN